MAENKTPNPEQVLIIPAVAERSEHVIEYIVAESIADVTNRAAGKAISFSNLRVLECVIEYKDLFGMELVYLSGFPGARYDAVYDKVTWSLDRVSYDQLVADITAAKRLDTIKTGQERKGPHRSEAGPKTFSAFDMHQKSGPVEEIDDDNPPNE